jgi:hypothetical protein
MQLGSNNTDSSDEPSLKRRLKTLGIGAVIALVAGIGISSLYLYVQYGASPLDMVLKRERRSPNAGKLAYDKSTNIFLGIIKSEGHSTRRGADVFYVERAGGQLIEVQKSNVTVREPGHKSD